MIVVAQKCGQLGNRLILGAHCIALAREFGWQFCYPAFCDYATYFEGPSASTWSHYPPRATRGWLPRATAFRIANFTARALRKSRCSNRLIQTVTIPGNEPKDDVDLAQPDWRARIEAAALTFLMGWRIRNYPLVEKHQDEIRQYFRPILTIRERVDTFLRSIRSGDRPLVGVHIRQGDYRNFLGGKYFFESQQYIAYMRRVQELVGLPVRYVLCSDSPQSRESFAGMDVHLGPGHPMEDMHVLAGCDVILGVPSTFSRWAAFVGSTKLCLMGETPPDKMTAEHLQQQGNRI